MEPIQIINSNNIEPITLKNKEISLTPILTPKDGAKWRTSLKIQLGKNQQTKPISLSSECVFFVMYGKGIIFDETENQKENIQKDKMIFITPDTLFGFITLEDELTLLGGPCPYDKNIMNIGD
jgi:hypothetical protein